MINGPDWKLMWNLLKKDIPHMVVAGDMIHLSDLERAMDELESDEEVKKYEQGS
jgi:hypothetical protein